MVRRLLLVSIALIVVMTGGRALAHDPLFLTPEQTTPETGPFLPDGTISFAIYGDIAGPGDSRGMQVAFEAGDRLLVEVLIPALSPESDLADEHLPVATVVAPDGTETALIATQRERFDEPFSATSYFSLARLDGEAQAGIYDITVTGDAAARFTVAVGTIETFLTPVERVENRATSFDEITEPLADWYAGVGTTIEASEPVDDVADEETERPTAAAITTPDVAEPPAPTAAAAPTPTVEAAEIAVAELPVDDGDGGLALWLWIVGLSVVLAGGGLAITLRR